MECACKKQVFSKKLDNVNEIAKMKKSFYVDGFILGGFNAIKVKKLKQLIINIFEEAPS